MIKTYPLAMLIAKKDSRPEGYVQAVLQITENVDLSNDTITIDLVKLKNLQKEYNINKIPPITEGGPGTELKKLLKFLGIKIEAGCQCEIRAAIMDMNGPDWCEQNIDTIIGWLREEAENRELIFNEFLAKKLVKYAIRRARRVLAKAAKS